jgi:hypothetical protein
MRVFLGPWNILQQVADSGSRGLSGERLFRARGQLGAQLIVSRAELLASDRLDL